MKSAKLSVTMLAFIALAASAQAPTLAQQRSSTGEIDSSRTARESTTGSTSDRSSSDRSSSDRSTSDRSSIDRRERVRRMRDNYRRTRTGTGSGSDSGTGSSGVRGTNVVTEDERNANSRAAGGRGTNVITEDDREHSQDRKINELTTRMEALERRVKELEQARQR